VRRFLIIQSVIKLIIILQNLWYVKILGDETSELFMVLSSVSAFSLMLDLNSSVEINRLDSIADKINISNVYLKYRAIFGIVGTLILFIYFYFILSLNIISSAVTLLLFLDGISGIFMTKYLAIHELKKYHFFTIYQSTIKILFPILFHWFFGCIELGILVSSGLATAQLVYADRQKIVLINNKWFKTKELFSLFSIGVLINLVQKLDVFLMADTNYIWKSDFFVYNRFYEFALFPISLMVGYRYKDLKSNGDKIVNIISLYQLVFVILMILFYYLFARIFSFNEIFFVHILKLAFIILGMYMIPIYSKMPHYSRADILMLLTFIILCRLIIPMFWDLDIWILVLNEFLLLMALFYLSFIIKKKIIRFPIYD
jgi:hypothetical protein